MLICEGMYGDKDRQEKARQYKHMTFYEALKLQTAKVKELWLTHYSPSLSRPSDYMEETRKIFANTRREQIEKLKH